MNLFDFFRQGKQISELRQSLDTLQTEIAEMKKSFKVIEDEWDDWFDRFRRLHARIARRQQREDQTEDVVREDAPTAEGENGSSPFATLSPAARAANDRILRRRMLMRGGQ